MTSQDCATESDPATITHTAFSSLITRTPRLYKHNDQHVDLLRGKSAHVYDFADDLILVGSSQDGTATFIGFARPQAVSSAKQRAETASSGARSTGRMASNVDLWRADKATGLVSQHSADVSVAGELDNAQARAALTAFRSAQRASRNLGGSTTYSVAQPDLSGLTLSSAGPHLRRITIQGLEGAEGTFLGFMVDHDGELRSQQAVQEGDLNGYWHMYRLQKHNPVPAVLQYLNGPTPSGL